MNMKGRSPEPRCAANVDIRPVPKYPQYAYAVVNNRRIIVEPKTRQVLKIYE
jgi:Protein of unknown function (DUF1236)